MKRLLSAFIFIAVVNTAGAQQFTVECGPIDIGPSGTWVVAGVFTEYVPLLGTVILVRTSCSTAGGGGSIPILPPDGMRCFFTAKDEPTIGVASADVTPTTTRAVCLQSTLDGLVIEPVTAETSNTGRPSRPRRPHRPRR